MSPESHWLSSLHHFSRMVKLHHQADSYHPLIGEIPKFHDEISLDPMAVRAPAEGANFRSEWNSDLRPPWDLGQWVNLGQPTGWVEYHGISWNIYVHRIIIAISYINPWIFCDKCRNIMENNYVHQLRIQFPSRVSKLGNDMIGTSVTGKKTRCDCWLKWLDHEWPQWVNSSDPEFQFPGLVNVYKKTMERSTILNWYINYKWPCFIAFCMFTRG